MSNPLALPAPGGNATAALALANSTQPEEVVIHSGAATTEGDMSYLEEDFDPCRHDPRRNIPGVLDANIDISQLNTINFNNVDNRTAQVAVVQQGVDPALANQLMAAQQQALQSEANALHSEVMERQRQELVSEARDQLASVEKQAADEISRKNLLLNEQAAQAMSEQKSAQLHVHAQDHRIRELSAELSQVMNTAGAMTSSAEKSNADLQNARSELAEYRTQIEAMNQYNMDMKRMAESQKKDFEAEIAKLRDEQKQLIRSLKSQPLEGTSGPQIHYGPGKPVPQASQPSRPIIEEVKSGTKPKHSSDADDEHFMADPMHPPGLPGGQPPDDDDDDDDFDDKRGHKDKKDKKKGRKTSRGRSRRRRRKDPSSSPSSSSPSTTSGSDSESSFARKVKRALERSRASDNKAKESDRILVPKFPQPENYRNWRIRVRDAVIAASSKPDLAFQWVEEVFKTDQSVEALKDSGKFVTLDAKLMSSLTNICEGDFARQLDIFKEEQAKSGTPARGRQALLMIHKHFSTSRKHGAVYDIEDLMAVTLVNDDLRGFITRWDAVIAGMTSEPDMMWKQAYFHNAIKNFKPLSHDLAVYDRTPEGEPNRSYDFLMKAARDYTSRGSVLKRCVKLQRSQFQVREMPPQRPPDLRLRAKPQAFATTSRLASALVGRIAVTNMRKLRKEKVEAKRGNPGPSQEALAGLCLQDLGIKFANFGRPVSVNVEVTVLSNTPQSLQLHLPKMTSVERARRRRTRRRVIAHDHLAEDPTPREALRVSKIKGENHLLLAQLQFAWCALWWWSQSLILRPVLIACRKALPHHASLTSSLPCQLHPIALFHLGTTMKSSKFLLSTIAICIRAKPRPVLTIQFASQVTIVFVKIRFRLVKVMPYLQPKCCNQLSFESCMGNLANATLHVTVI